MKLTSDIIVFTCRQMPKWNPMNVCSYHLQEAGATPVQELAFSLANACCVLDHVRPQVAKEEWQQVVGRMSFFVNAGMHFITELCKMRAFAELWDEITRKTYGVSEPRYRRFRYGVQVNSLGLTEQQPENNVYRILISMLSVVLSKQVRARAIQLPAWNEALGLPRPWDQQWSLRLQQIMAFESDLLEHEDIFAGSTLIDAKVQDLKEQARTEMQAIDSQGGLVQAVMNGYLKGKLVEANAARQRDIESGRKKVVGVNCYESSLPSPLVAEGEGAIFVADKDAEAQQIARLKAWRKQREQKQVDESLARLKACAHKGDDILEASIACAHAGVTTGEWGACMREVYGEYRAPTGLSGEATHRGQETQTWQQLRAKVEAATQTLGRRPKMLVGKPGLDGHSNGAEQIATRAKDAGFEVLYQGIRLTPQQIVNTAMEEGVHIIGLSVLSGSHNSLVADVLEKMKAGGIDDIPLVVGGIIPPVDAKTLRKKGVAAVYTPKDFNVTRIMDDIIDIVIQNKS